jgi:AhpD family alkylhydroperoxidase
MSTLEEFEKYREQMNDLILSCGNQQMKRFFNVDTAVYREGALSKKTKELLGLVASTVLRCNDCITYHLMQCEKKGVTREELYEALTIALIVGGSITIPHIRYAFEICDDLYD